MPDSVKNCPADGGAPLTWNPVLNRGTNFSRAERQEKHLRGLLPPRVESLDVQAERVMVQLREEAHTALAKYGILMQLASTNSTLFYAVMERNLVELMPVVYTPTVGEACVKYDRIYRTDLGMYFSAFHDRGAFANLVANCPLPDVKIVVVTDGGRVLGLGDLGTNGMGISVGKIALYVAGGGFAPDSSLPVALDCGTDRAELLESKFYLGEKQPRIRGEEQLAIVEELCEAIAARWPGCLIQFEDFQTEAAFAILERMRERVLCFNDDIQGTGAVVLSGFVNGMKAQGTDMRDVRVVFYGAGSSAAGVAAMIASLIKTYGVSEQEAYQAIYMVDSKGLITSTRGDKLPAHKVPFARRDGTPDMKNLKDILAHVKPHALFGLSGQGPSFFQEHVEEVCRHHDHPLIFPLSNPTSKAEITAEQAYTWSDGKCIFAAGSPFDPVQYKGRTYVPGQGNNVFVFPGLGFGAVSVRARYVPDEFLVQSALAVAEFVTVEEAAAGRVYPDLGALREVSLAVATRVAECAFDMGIAQIERPDDIRQFLADRMWTPSAATTLQSKL
uniref:Malic enzyme n=1 Tax=Tetraselmis chuii TaxID=63592 RepID=A0A7S1SX40_9CHLO